MTASREPRFHWWLFALGLVVLVAATYFLWQWAAPIVTRARLEAWVRDAGPWGPLVLLGIQVAQILAAPIPGVLVPILAGVFYGPVVGPMLTVGGTLIGSALAYWIGRTAGHRVAERWVGAPAIEKARALIHGKRWLALAAVFLLPFSPADALCFVAGIVEMRWGLFAAAILLGRVPKEVIIAAGAAL